MQILDRDTEGRDVLTQEEGLAGGWAHEAGAEAARTSPAQRRLRGRGGHSAVLSLCVSGEKAPGLIQTLCRLRDRWVSQQGKYASVGFEVAL